MKDNNVWAAYVQERREAQVAAYYGWAQITVEHVDAYLSFLLSKIQP